MTDTIFSLPEGTHTVALGMGDLNGVLRGKRIPSSCWEAVCEGGTAISQAVFTMDMTCDVWNTPYVNFDNGYPDMHMFPISKPVSLPWEPGVAFCLARGEGMDHKSVPIDPRTVLLRQVKRAEEMGYTVKIGAELEFYLLDPETLQPREQGIQAYSLERAAEIEHILGPIRRQINEAGIPIEQSNPEYASGQVEVNIRYDDAIKTADNAVKFRSLVKQLANRHGYLATFMAKPFIERSGSGLHTHYSLWKDGRNTFAENGKLSELGRSFVAGLQKRMGETGLCGATTPNAFKRRQPYSFCPINTSWGIDNRTVGIRIIEGRESEVRAEKRDGSADCNPYILMAIELAAGLDGIEQRLNPSSICTGNAYEDCQATLIPTNIDDAITVARKSDFMREVLGDHLFELLVQQAEREKSFIQTQVTPVEIDRYMQNF